ncbi:MAG: sensor histidine kinase [Bacteroidia bacterium]|nr:sensor histidine kinase [Bacteroidia bacterium]
MFTGRKLIFIYFFLLLTTIHLKANPPVRAMLSLELSNKLETLDKDWNFYWQTTYHQIHSDTLHYLQPKEIKVPGPWQSLGLGSYGYGTYVLRFTHNNKLNTQLALKLLNIGTSYNLYIDGVKMSSVGVFSIVKEGAKPEYRPQLIYFNTVSDTVEIAIEVSNYFYREGGIWFSPVISNAELIRNNTNRKMVISAFLCGALIVLFGYFTSFYYISTHDKTSLYFALTCLFSALRLASTEEVIIRQLNLPVSWEVLVKIEFVSLILLVLFGILYLCSLFTRDVNQRVLNILTGINAIIALFFIFTPVKLASEFIPYYLSFDVFLLLYLLNIIIKILVHKRPYSIAVTSAYILIFLTGMNDILYSQEIIHSVYLLPLGIFAFSFIQAFTLTHKFSNAFNEVKELSIKLSETNRNQGVILEERTAQLNKHTSELQKSNVVKDKVFSIIAHDLRAPINSLSTLLGWVADDDIGFEDLKKSLKGIRKNVDTLNLTLENILLWSRGQIKGVKSSPELQDLRTNIIDVFELYRIQTKEKGIVLSSKIIDRVLVYIDKNHLNLLMRNLISNAIKFTNSGGEVTISSKNCDHEMMQICVTDTGIGMSPENVVKAFMTNDHHTTYGTLNEKGTGLGLMLCKEYIEQNGGKIWLESTPGVGTKVFFTLKTSA